MLMTAADYRKSLRAYKPRVFVNGQRVECVADEPLLPPGINAVGVTHDFAHRAGRSEIPMEQRMDVARFIEDLTVSNQGGWYSVISPHGVGSPEAMKREIWRNYPVMEKVELVESLLDRGILADGRRVSKQPGRCCPTGCEVPKPSAETQGGLKC
jgi:aromatic ring hydroxylase